MLSEKEKSFISYWREQRLRKKEFFRRLSVGLPLASLLGVAILINLFSGWYKRADMALHMDGSVIVVILLAVVGIVVFITIFSNRYQWEQNETHYQELLAKSKKEDIPAA